MPGMRRRCVQSFGYMCVEDSCASKSAFFVRCKSVVEIISNEHQQVRAVICTGKSNSFTHIGK